MNATSQHFMIDNFGNETKDWIGKEVSLFAVSQMIQGKMKKVIYFGENPSDEKTTNQDDNIPTPTENDINF